jgi:hypothetical protein
MNLYMAVSTAYARRVIDEGFVGRSVSLLEGGETEVCEFRDIPPVGLTVSLTAEAEAENTEKGSKVTIGTGPVLADDIGDFVLSIEVTSEMGKEYEIDEETAAGWPFREHWLPPEVANAHRGSLKVFISESGEEVSSPTEVLLRDHEVLLTEVFEDAPAGALCVCGQRWALDGRRRGPAHQLHSLGFCPHPLTRGLFV